MLWMVNWKTGDDNDLYWLKSSVCFAWLGFQLGDAGVTSLFEAFVSRKKIMQYAQQKSIGSFIGSAIGSVWAITCTVILKSSFLASLPLVASSGFLIYMLYLKSKKHISEHSSHAIKL